MRNKTLEQEKKYLSDLIDALKLALSKLEGKISNVANNIQEDNEYLWDNVYDIDPEEASALRQNLKTTMSVGENMVSQKNKLKKLLFSPFFARIDFSNSLTNVVSPIYIGLHNFKDEQNSDNQIYDWRAPISSMYYDFEIGKAYYAAPSGLIEGDIVLKRQYNIKAGSLNYMFESTTAIEDEILQQELKASSDDKMKGIVATIQREQNLIIRNEKAHNIIIQGVAGSGKSSIALHRAAFLLYRRKDEISSKNILIISPNKVFADYISNVLPDLGEEKILELSFDDIARGELSKVCKYQSFFEQVEKLLVSDDSKFAERIKFKSSYSIIDQLRTFVNKRKNTNFRPKSIKFSTFTIPSTFIIQEYCKYSRMSDKDKEIELLNCILRKFQHEYRYKLHTDDKKRIRLEVRSMFQKESILEMYKNFYSFIGHPEFFVMEGTNKVEYSDVFPLVYLKMLVDGPKDFSFVKHLIVDEMQDYTPIQYAIISMLFKCDKTILGDSFQSVNPYSSSSIETISKVFPDAECMSLFQSYRSSFEITDFAQKILRNNDLKPFERHGLPVEVKKCKNAKEQLDYVLYAISKSKQENLKSIGIVCRTQKEAELLFAELEKFDKNIYLLTPESNAYVRGVVISSIHMSKGLEFDSVIIPNVDVDNYKSEMDRNLLYIACTRAMHSLKLCYTNKRTDFIR